MGRGRHARALASEASLRAGRTIPIIIAAACLAPASADAQIPGYNPWKHSQAVWKLRDQCRRSAFKQFPDYTAESNAKRDRAEQRCLEASNLPTSPPQAPRESSGSSRR
jgi:hypothetical protein